MDLIDGLCLFNRNCTGFTHFDAALTTQTFVSIYRNRFIILHLKHFNRDRHLHIPHNLRIFLRQQ